MSRGIWNTLEALAEAHPPAAVVAEWRALAGADFGTLGAFLSPTSRLALDYPCLSEPGCGCRHELVPLDGARWLARCECGMGGCRATRLTEDDLWIHELDAGRFGAAVGGALGFEPAQGGGRFATAPKVWPAGIHRETRSPAFLFLCPNPGQLLANLQGLAGACAEPFIVLAPTGQARSELVGTFLQRERCGFVPLAPCLAPDGGGWRATVSIEPVLERFATGLAGGRRIAPVREDWRVDDAGQRSTPRNGFARAGSHWDVTFDGGRTFHLPHTLGAEYLDYLLHHPSQPISAYDLEMVIRPEKAKARPKDSVQSNLDGDAVRDYLRQLDKLRSQREEAAEDGDLARVDQLDGDIVAIEVELKRSGQAPDAGERSRGNVGKAIAAVQRKLRRGDDGEQAFARHLEQFVSLGYECSYNQPQGYRWG